MTDRVFHPDRLILARQRLGWSKVQLARELKSVDRTVTHWENGTRDPSPAMIAKLSTALEVPEEFFYGPHVEFISEDAPSFRALSKMSSGRRSSALAYGTLALELSAWLDQRFDLPPADVPRLENGAKDPDAAARRVRAAWSLGIVPVGNLVHLVESHGVRVFSLPEQIDDVDAFSLWWRGTPIMLVSTRRSPERGRFDVAHELGHLVMHSDWDLPRAREREWEANRFAAAFLMPEEDVLAARLRNADLDRIIHAKQRWGVAAMALTHRLHELGLVTDWGYRSICVRLSEQGYRRGEHNGLAHRETSQLLEKALKALRTKNVSVSDIAADLRIHSSEMRKMLFGLTLTSVDGGGGDGRRAGALTLVPDSEDWFEAGSPTSPRRR